MSEERLAQAVERLTEVLTEIKEWLLTNKKSNGPAPSPAPNLEQQARQMVQGFKCPDCGAPMKARMAKATGDWFAGCTKFPDCTATRDLNGRVNRSSKKQHVPPVEKPQQEHDDVPF